MHPAEATGESDVFVKHAERCDDGPIAGGHLPDNCPPMQDNVVEGGAGACRRTSPEQLLRYHRVGGDASATSKVSSAGADLFDDDAPPGEYAMKESESEVAIVPEEPPWQVEMRIIRLSR